MFRRPLALALLCCAAAFAAGFDKVRLKSGAVLQGTILEGGEPGKALKIRLLSGRVQDVKGSEISKIELGHAHDAPLPLPLPKEVPATVWLKDGGSLKGTIVELKLGKELTLRLSSGRTLTIADEDVARVEMETAAAAPPASPAAAARAPEPTSRAPDAASPTAGLAKQELPPDPPPPLLTVPQPPLMSQRGPPDRRAADLDTVELQDGRIWRGRVVDDAAGRLTLRLADGSTRTVGAAQLKSRTPRESAFVETLDSVWLRDGSVLRGRLSSRPGPDLELRLLSGRVVPISSAQIDRVVRRKEPPP